MRKATPVRALSRARGESPAVLDPRHVGKLRTREPGELVTARRRASRKGKAEGRDPEMYGDEQSDKPVVPTKGPNKAGTSPVAEALEGRGLAEGNPRSRRGRPDIEPDCRPSGVERVRQAAERNRQKRFTALLHHVNPESLKAAYDRLRTDAVAGIDGVTKEHYGRALEENLEWLNGQVHRGAYKPKPAKRVYITKEDGTRRPLAMGALTDKIVQGAVAEVLGAIFEVDFKGYSYGFRPGRSQHDALNALAVGITRKKVSWILDLDIKSYFDSIDREKLLELVEIRIADKRILRLIQRWLDAGVVDKGELLRGKRGTPQGATISPLLSNVYLHYALDCWASEWRRQASGDIIIVRYADDVVVGFQHRSEAKRFLGDLRARLVAYGLELHPDKTRLIEFGRFAAEGRAKRGEGKPESFTFLGLTHSCGKSKRGKFLLLRHTAKKRLRAKLKKVKQELRRRMHASIPEQGAWLRSVLRGYFNYHAVPTNIAALRLFRAQVARHWQRSLRRRSQKGDVPWKRMQRRCKTWLPEARILHPWPSYAALRHHPRQEPSAVVPLAGI